MTRYEEFVERAKSKWGGDKLDLHYLCPKFVDAFNTQERIRVKAYGCVMTGTVGVTTGCAPAFLLMRTSRSLGSSEVLSEAHEFTDEKVGYGGNK